MEFFRNRFFMFFYCEIRSFFLAYVNEFNFILTAYVYFLINPRDLILQVIIMLYNKELGMIKNQIYYQLQ